jgi:hypothetical protein
MLSIWLLSAKSMTLKIGGYIVATPNIWFKVMHYVPATLHWVNIIKLLN